jgi:DNA-binding GntR family transcriptional regulator
MEFRGCDNRSRVRTWLRGHLRIIDAPKADKFGEAPKLMTVHLDKAYGAAAALRCIAAKRRISGSS